MTLFISESEVRGLFPMARALERVEASFRAQHDGKGINRPRQRLFLSGCSLHYMAAALPEENLLGMKIYTVTSASFRFVVLLFDAVRGELLAFIEADHLGRIRTGAASGVATKYLARAARRAPNWKRSPWCAKQKPRGYSAGTRYGDGNSAGR
jgi:alanine dehydrogenase